MVPGGGFEPPTRGFSIRVYDILYLIFQLLIVYKKLTLHVSLHILRVLLGFLALYRCCLCLQTGSRVDHYDTRIFVPLLAGQLRNYKIIVSKKITSLPCPILMNLNLDITRQITYNSNNKAHMVLMSPAMSSSVVAFAVPRSASSLRA